MNMNPVRKPVPGKEAAGRTFSQDYLKEAPRDDERPSSRELSMVSNSSDFDDGIRNHLLASLPRDEYAFLTPVLEAVNFPKNRVLYEAGNTMRHAIFIKRGVASVLAITEDGLTIEIGTVGNEGFVGVPIILGADTAPYRIMAQTPIDGFRIDRKVLRSAFNRGGKLQEMLLRYANVLQTQAVQTVVCKQFHSAEQRLSGRLLATSDCLEADILEVTQEQIASMLTAHRNRVSVAVRALQKSGLIECSRRRIMILDRDGLKAIACECYGIVKECIGALET
jgi:CRP-like cAMP-binding protein